MGKAAALEGDVIAMPGQLPYPPADSGAWVATPVKTKADSKITVGGKAVIYEAECKFIFTGTYIDKVTGVPVPVSGQETVTLSAKNTKLQKKMLVQGDMIQGSYGNQLKVQTASKLATG